MMQSPIIDIRGHLRWYQRMVSSSLTLALWGAWTLLWSPVIQLASRHTPLRNLLMGAALPRELGLATHAMTPAAATLLGTSSLLLLWQFLITRGRFVFASRNESLRGSSSSSPTIADYAERCGLTDEQLRRARLGKILVVHHTDRGVMTAVEERLEPSLSVAA